MIGLLILAWIEVAAFVLAVVLCFALGWWLGLRRKGSVIPKRVNACLTASVFATTAFLVVTWKFLPQTWTPLPNIEFVLPNGFANQTLFLLEDKRSTAKGTWTGITAPFSSKTLVLEIPASGVLRINDLSEVLNTRFTQGDQPFFPFGCHVTPAMGATGCLGAAARPPNEAVKFPHSPENMPLTPDKFTDYLLQREQGQPR